MYACSLHQLREQFLTGLNNRIHAKVEGSGFRAHMSPYPQLLGAALDTEAAVRIEDRGLSRVKPPVAQVSNSRQGVSRVSDPKTASGP